MADYQYVQTTGLIVPDTSDLRTAVAQEWTDAFGTIDTSAHTPQGVMITAETLAREAMVNNNVAVANQINPNQAGGVWLDAICALLGLERRSAASSTIPTVTLTGIPGTNIPANTQFKSVAGDIWTMRTAVPLNTLGVATVDVSCIVPGPVACAIGELTQIFTPVLGLESVYNPNAAALGYEQEGDIELAERRRLTLARQGISTAEAQVSALFDINGVTSVAWRENTAATTQTIDGIVMKPHSVWACIDGGDTTAVALAIWTNKTAGAAFNGAQVVNVTDQFSGQTVGVQFDRPTVVSVQVAVTGRIQTGGDASVNPVTAIPQAVADWAAGKFAGDPGLTIGTEVSVFEIGGAINIAVPGFHATSVVLSRGGTVQPGNVAITLTQRAVINPADVTVTIA